MPAPGPDDFAALARSSPWGWTTLRFTLRWYPEDRMPPVQAWVRRPADVRVEPHDGGPATIVHERPNGHLLPGDPHFPEPIRRADGLVARRGLAWADAFDAPMYNTYFWVAMLDPVELAEGQDPESDERRPGTVIADVAEVDHLGRPAWEAVLRPTAAYQPRCGCCALLPTREGDQDQVGPPRPLTEYPEAFRVRLDVGTGVCVLTRALDVPVRYGHDLRIEAVDEPMDDDLFRPPPYRRPRLDGPPRPALAPPDVQ